MKPKKLEWIYEGECIRCTSHKLNLSGYQRIKRNGRTITISNEIARRFRGLVNGMCARHTCDNAWCINPNHIVAGTLADNNRDRAERGRSARSVPSRRKISQTQAEEIRLRFSKRKRRDKINGVMAIARDYQVDPNVVYNIALNRTHVS